MTRFSALFGVLSGGCMTDARYPHGGRHGAPGPTSLPVLATVFLLVTLLAVGPLAGVDRALDVPWSREWPQLRPVLEVVVRLGQRVVCVPLLVVVAAMAARRVRSWQPLLVAVGSIVALNVLVGLVKICTARGGPTTGDPSFFRTGTMFPSGHAANAILVYGVSTMVARRAWGAGAFRARLLAAMTVATSVAMVLIGLYFQWHWFTDLLGGLAIGGVVLKASSLTHAHLKDRAVALRQGPPQPS